MEADRGRHERHSPNQFVRVVREDPVRTGLLYAGTEFGIFVSFDDGAHWRSMQENLPHTPVTDMKIYRDDLILSTQGRGFYIVDNLSVIRGAAWRAAAGRRAVQAGGRVPAGGQVPTFYYWFKETPTAPVTRGEERGGPRGVHDDRAAWHRAGSSRGARAGGGGGEAAAAGEGAVVEAAAAVAEAVRRPAAGARCRVESASWSNLRLPAYFTCRPASSCGAAAVADPRSRRVSTPSRSVPARGRRLRRSGSAPIRDTYRR